MPRNNGLSWIAAGACAFRGVMPEPYGNTYSLKARGMFTDSHRARSEWPEQYRVVSRLVATGSPYCSRTHSIESLHVWLYVCIFCIREIRGERGKMGQADNENTAEAARGSGGGVWMGVLFGKTGRANQLLV